MVKKGYHVAMRAKLLSRTSELNLTYTTDLAIAELIVKQSKNMREAKAKEILQLLEGLTTEEEVKKALNL